MKTRFFGLAFGLVGVVLFAGCGKISDSGATSNPINAPSVAESSAPAVSIDPPTDGATKYFPGPVAIGTTDPSSAKLVVSDGGSFSNGILVVANSYYQADGITSYGGNHGVVGIAPIIGVKGMGEGTGVSGTGGSIGIHGRGDDWAGYFQGRGYFSGSVGIGIENPTEAIDVKGKVKANDFLYKNALGEIKSLNETIKILVARIEALEKK